MTEQHVQRSVIRTELLARPPLERRLDAAFGKRLTVITADAGFGKTSLLRMWAADLAHAWYTLTSADRDLETLVRGVVASVLQALPNLGAVSAGTAVEPVEAEAQAAWICRTLATHVTHDFMLVLDDVHELHPDTDAARFVEGLCRHASPNVHLVLASRAEPPFRIERLKGRSEVLELNAQALAFDADDVGALVYAATGAENSDLVAELVASTGGWPAAVRLALDSLEEGATFAKAFRPGGDVYAYLAGEALADAAEPVRELLRRSSPFDRVSVDLCTALDVPDAEEAMVSLVKRGLATELPDGGQMIHSLVREFARLAWPLDADEARRIHRTAAAWLAERGRVEEALRALAATADHEALSGLLAEHGPALLASGAAAVVIRHAQLLPDALRTASVDQVVGEAHAALGQFEDALRLFARAAGDAERLPPALAWRMVRAHHLQGDLDGAVRTYERSRGVSGAPEDEALLTAWTATSQVRHGDTEAGRTLAATALEAATRSGNPGATAAAHTAVALVAEADGDLATSAAHIRSALAAAERADDVLQQSRIHNNAASVLTAHGRYREALAALERSIALSERFAFPPLLGLALMNRGFCHWCLGELDEANADYTASMSVFRTAGGREISYALIGQGDVYRERGDQTRARRLYEEGLAIAERTGDLQGLVPGLYQLAKVLVDDDPDRALELARRATGFGWPDKVWALNALGWVTLALGDRAAADAAAAEAAAEARSRGERFGLAEALELRAFTSNDAADRDGLDEALDIWTELGSPLRVAAVELASARLQSGLAAQAVARRAERRLRALGVRVSRSCPAGLLRTIAFETDEPLAVQTLGGFHVLRHGDPVPFAEWRSKKARDLVKILVTRNGAPSSRERLIDELWPDADPAAAGNRMSVALSTARTVLDPDRRFAQDHFIAADNETVRLRPEHVSIDVQVFLHDAAEGLELRRVGRLDEAAERLRAAEEAYAGDFLEENSYDDWAAPLRDEATAAYIDVLRSLADDSAESGDGESAVRFYLRLLERDRYDEPAHLSLVRTLDQAGRHGEARRRFRTYCACMREIDVEAAPFPAA